MRTWSRSKSAIGALVLCSLVAIAWGYSATTAGARGGRGLEGSIWVGKKQHRRVTVTTDGTIEIKEGKDIYVRFLERVDDIYVIEVRWWNESANINVLEHGVLTQISPNIYRYFEADHLEFGMPNNNFPGIIGRGTFELQGRNRAKLIQVGHLIDGSASGFTTVLERARSVPVVPIDQTYP